MKDKTVMQGLNEPFCKRQTVCTSNKSSVRRIRRLGFLIGRPLNTCKWFKPNKKEEENSFSPFLQDVFETIIKFNQGSNCLKAHIAGKCSFPYMLHILAHMQFHFSLVDAEAQSNWMSDIHKQLWIIPMILSVKGSLNSSLIARGFDIVPKQFFVFTELHA